MMGANNYETLDFVEIDFLFNYCYDFGCFHSIKYSIWLMLVYYPSL